jgi:hypothetical protein
MLTVLGFTNRVAALKGPLDGPPGNKKAAGAAQ